jgi:hypothetical protein
VLEETGSGRRDASREASRLLFALRAIAAKVGRCRTSDCGLCSWCTLRPCQCETDGCVRAASSPDSISLSPAPLQRSMASWRCGQSSSIGKIEEPRRVRKQKHTNSYGTLSVSPGVRSRHHSSCRTNMPSALSRRHVSTLKNTVSASFQSTSGAAPLCCAR